MKLLHIIQSVSPSYGGPIEGLLQQNRITSRVGIERTIACCDRPDAPHLNEIPITVKAFGVASQIGRLPPLKRYGYSPGMVRWLFRNVANYDVVVVHGLWNYSTFAALWSLRYHSIPYVVYTHGMLDPWSKAAKPLKHLLKAVSWQFCEGPLLRASSGVLFTSLDEMESSVGAFRGAQFPAVVIPYGIGKSSEVDVSMDESAGIDKQPYALFLSRIHPKKGCDDLIASFAAIAQRFPSLRLAIAGPGPAMAIENLKSLAAKFGIHDRIDWLGPVYHDQKWKLLRGAKFFILPSHQENFGIAVVEAMAAGLPIITTDKVNIWREIKASGGGLICQDNVESISRAMLQMLELDEVELAEMGQAAHMAFERHFNVQNTAIPAVEIIARLTGKSMKQNVTFVLE